MKPYRKPRSDSRLKNLTQDQQAQIIAWLDSPKGYAGTVPLVQEQLGVKTSLTCLSEFHAWWHLRRDVEQAACFTAALKQTLVTLPELNLDQDRLNQATQLVLELDALKKRDLDALCRLRNIRQTDQTLRLYERHLALREAREKPVARKTPKKGGISTEVLAQIEKELNLL